MRVLVRCVGMHGLVVRSCGPQVGDKCDGSRYLLAVTGTPASCTAVLVGRYTSYDHLFL